MADHLQAIRDRLRVHNEAHFQELEQAVIELAVAKDADIQELAEILANIKWVSCEKDNMEFTAKITYFQMDAIRNALAKYKEAQDGEEN